MKIPKEALDRFGHDSGLYRVNLEVIPYKGVSYLTLVEVEAPNGVQAIRKAFAKFWQTEWEKQPAPVVVARLMDFYCLNMGSAGEILTMYRPGDPRPKPKRSRKKKNTKPDK